MNLIFPVAGEGSRFGGVFKPFNKIGDITFIEVTYEPFKKWKDKIESVIFICTEEQDKLFSVEKTMKEIIDHKNVKVVKLKNKTKGPYETISKSLGEIPCKESCIICDCDHSLNVDPIFNSVENNYDCIIPVWEFKEEEYQNWSKVVAKNNNIKMICEKEKVLADGLDVRGIIGCIYFKDLNFFKGGGVYVSDALSEMLKNNKVMKTVDIDVAKFYGDPDMLERHVNFLRKQCTIFCDIDGTLVKHEPHSHCDFSKTEVLPGYRKINDWKNNGHKVILTTARNEKYREELICLLNKLEIKYDQLIMSLPSGPRIVINDRKPSKLFTKQSNCVDIKRDSGIHNINIEDYTESSDIQVISKLNGNSFASTYLVNDHGNVFIRKHIEKNNNTVHYLKLKRQMEDIQRINFLWNDSTPKILSSSDNEYEFYYDMEYLENYTLVSDLEPKYQKEVLLNLLDKVEENLYSYKKEIEGMQWLQDHLDKKIFPKLEVYQKDKDFYHLINEEEILINGKKYFGLRKVLSEIDKRNIKPRYIRQIHGDFTLENVMVDENLNFKLIDMDGADYADAAELDLGKMCQSVLSRYSEWKNRDDLVLKLSHKDMVCCDDYFTIDGENLKSFFEKWSFILKEDYETTLIKGIFYMSMYFIRFVPFRVEVSKEHGIFAILMSIVWLNEILKRDTK